MERVIRTLKEMRDKAKEDFICNSIYVRKANPNSPIPDTQSDLDMIIELNQSISCLENSLMAVIPPPTKN